MQEWDGGGSALSVHVFRNGAKEHKLERTINNVSETFNARELDGIADFYLSLPLSLLNFRILKLPFSDRQKLRGIIPFELDNLVLGGADHAVFDFIVLGGAGNNYDVLVTYMDRKLLGDILDELTSMNIDPRTVTSVELQSVVSRGAEGIAAYISAPENMSAEGRTEAAKKELATHTINLRTGPLAYTKDFEKTKKNLRLTVVLSILLALIINADLAVRTIAMKKEASLIRTDIRTIYSGLFPGDKKVADEIYQMKSHMKEVKEKGDMLGGVRPLKLMMDLSRSAVQGAVFSEINIDRGLVMLKGEANSMEAVDRVKSRLAEFLPEASASDIKPSANGRFYFTVTARVRTT